MSTARVADAALRHVASAFARLAEGGRLVAITGANFSPDHPSWRDAFVRLQERGRVVFSASIEARVYARHGTTVETRLTVIDRVPASDPTVFPASPGMAPDAATLLSWVVQHVPPRLPVDGRQSRSGGCRVIPAAPSTAPSTTPNVAACRRVPSPSAAELAYETVDWKPAEDGRLTEALYEAYGLQSVRIDGARPHPTQAGAIRGDGFGGTAQAQLSATPAGQRRRRWPAVRCPARERHLCRRGP